jgi:TetR/AcrR family transcriptional regulator
VPPNPARANHIEAFLDAAERLLIQVGHGGISTRRLAEEAGANHGLVHYYFGSMEELFVQVLERFTSRLIERQRAMYRADVPFLQKWRNAMGFLEEDLAAGYPKIWLELQALAWNRSDLRERVGRVNEEWRAVLLETYGAAMAEYGLGETPFPPEAIVSLVMTFNQGLMLERLSGVGAGHAALLDSIDRWLVSLEEARRAREP